MASLLPISKLSTSLKSSPTSGQIERRHARPRGDGTPWHVEHLNDPAGLSFAWR